MEHQEAAPLVKEVTHFAELEKYGCKGVFIDGWSRKGEAAVPDAALITRIDTANQAVRSAHPEAKVVLEGFITHDDPSNVWDLVTASRLQYVRIALVDGQKAATQLPETATVLDTNTHHDVVNVVAEGPTWRLNKEKTQKAFVGFLDSLMQTGSYLTRKHGGADHVQLSLVEAMGKKSGVKIIALKK